MLCNVDMLGRAGRLEEYMPNAAEQLFQSSPDSSVPSYSDGQHILI